jgi:hypothetical protein
MSLDNTITAYRLARRKYVLKGARSFKEFLQWYVNFMCVDVCGEFGITGGAIVDYQAFAKKVLADWYSMVLNSTIPPSGVNVDVIMDYYEKTWVFPRKLNPAVVKALEEELLKIMNNINDLRAQFEELKST